MEIKGESDFCGVEECFVMESFGELGVSLKELSKLSKLFVK